MSTLLRSFGGIQSIRLDFFSMRRNAAELKLNEKEESEEDEDNEKMECRASITTSKYRMRYASFVCGCDCCRLHRRTRHSCTGSY